MLLELYWAGKSTDSEKNLFQFQFAHHNLIWNNPGSKPRLGAIRYRSEPWHVLNTVNSPTIFMQNVSSYCTVNALHLHYKIILFLLFREITVYIESHSNYNVNKMYPFLGKESPLFLNVLVNERTLFVSNRQQHVWAIKSIFRLST